MIIPARSFAALSRRIPQNRRYVTKSSNSEDEAELKLNVSQLHTRQTRLLADDGQELLNKFKDPSSHYHIPPGSKGPEHEDDHTSSRHPSSSSTSSSSSTLASSSISISSSTTTDEFTQSRIKAMEMFSNDRYDVNGTLEWPVAWGDCDMFQ